jgi:serine/threonine-protein kinase RsbW
MNREAAETREAGEINLSDPVSLKVPSCAEYVLLARLVVSQIGQLAGFEPEDVYDLKLAVTEAVTNVIRHTTVEVFEVEYRVLAGAVEVTVKDAGGGFEAGDLSPAPDAQGGFGLAVIQSLVDEVKLESVPGGGTKLRMVRRAAAAARTETG